MEPVTTTGTDCAYMSPFATDVTARNAKGSATANSAITTIVAPAVTITNKRPTIVVVSVRFSGATVYARFRICDDSSKNLTVLATDSRPNVASYTRRFTTLVPPRPCGVYTRHWTPALRFVTKPIFALLLFNSVIAVTHFPQIVNLSLRNELFHFSMS